MRARLQMPDNTNALHLRRRMAGRARAHLIVSQGKDGAQRRRRRPRLKRPRRQHEVVISATLSTAPRFAPTNAVGRILQTGASLGWRQRSTRWESAIAVKIPHFQSRRPLSQSVGMWLQLLFWPSCSCLCWLCWPCAFVGTGTRCIKRLPAAHADARTAVSTV